LRAHGYPALTRDLADRTGLLRGARSTRNALTWTAIGHVDDGDTPHIGIAVLLRLACAGGRGPKTHAASAQRVRTRCGRGGTVPIAEADWRTALFGALVIALAGNTATPEALGLIGAGDARTAPRDRHRHAKRGPGDTDSNPPFDHAPASGVEELHGQQRRRGLDVLELSDVLTLDEMVRSRRVPREGETGDVFAYHQQRLDSGELHTRDEVGPKIDQHIRTRAVTAAREGDDRECE
jgi:hypothetical protein